MFLAQKNGLGKMDTPFYHIVWDKKGRMTSIFDKENDREDPEGR